MKAHVKYARSRNQLYHLKVALREVRESTNFRKPTPELRQALDMLDTIVDTACQCFERGHILEVLVNEYVPTALPGFGEMMDDLLQAAKFDRAAAWDPQPQEDFELPSIDWLDDINDSDTEPAAD